MPAPQRQVGHRADEDEVAGISARQREKVSERLHPRAKRALHERGAPVNQDRPVENSPKVLRAHEQVEFGILTKFSAIGQRRNRTAVVTSHSARQENRDSTVVEQVSKMSTRTCFVD